MQKQPALYGVRKPNIGPQNYPQVDGGQSNYD